MQKQKHKVAARPHRKKTRQPVKNRAAKKSARSQKRSKVVQAPLQLDELIKRGRERGFVTESEILHYIPRAEENVEELEKLYASLEASDVRVVETASFFDTQSKKSGKAPGTGKPRREEIGRASCRERVEISV